MNVTLSPDPGGSPTVTFQVDGLGISESATASAGTAIFTISTVVADNSTIWDATLQVDSNTAVEAAVQVVETNDAQSIGVTLSSTDVTYCSPLAGGGGTGTVTNVTGTAPISVATGTTTPVVSLDADGITTGKIADEAVTNGKIADLTIQTGKIADDAITAAKLADTSVTLGAYTNADITVDAQGRLTAAASGSAGGVTSITGGSLIDVDQATGVVEVSHAPKGGTGVSTSYPGAITVDSFGHVVATGATSTPVIPSNNLSDLTSETTARTNLGLTAAATTAIGTTAGDLIVLDGSARLPAVNGSQLTDLPSGGSTDWKWDPESTTYIRIFDDFLASSMGDSVDANGGAATQFCQLGSSGGYWRAWVNQIEDSGFDLRGFVYADNGTNVSARSMANIAQLLSNSPSDGDEVMVEFKVKFDIDKATGGNTVFWLSAYRSDNVATATSVEASNGYSDIAKAGICARALSTNFEGYVYDNAGTNGGVTYTDTGVASADNTFYRIGLHYKYASTGTKYVCKAFINGTQVYTADITTGTGSPYLQMGIYNSSKAYDSNIMMDYGLLQYTAPTITWKNITAV
jgi:hypothetical protein